MSLIDRLIRFVALVAVGACGPATQGPDSDSPTDSVISGDTDLPWEMDACLWEVGCGAMFDAGGVISIWDDLTFNVIEFGATRDLARFGWMPTSAIVQTGPSIWQGTRDIQGSVEFLAPDEPGIYVVMYQARSRDADDGEFLTCTPTATASLGHMECDPLPTWPNFNPRTMSWIVVE